MNQIASDNLQKGEVFLAENKTKEGIETLPSGLQYKVLQSGEGSQPQSNDEVTVHYKGTLIDGSEFDSSYSRGQPATFPVNGVIAGWVEALQLMREGAKWELIVHPAQPGVWRTRRRLGNWPERNAHFSGGTAQYRLKQGIPMGNVYPALDQQIANWISQQKMFFVSTAPISETGLINCSPKGLDTFAIIDPHTVAYLDLIRSGVETIAHLKENGRIVLMFCAFEGAAKIFRLHGIR